MCVCVYIFFCIRLYKHGEKYERLETGGMSYLTGTENEADSGVGITKQNSRKKNKISIFKKKAFMITFMHLLKNFCKKCTKEKQIV